MAAQVQHRDTVRKPRESWEAAIWRLAGEAQEAGIRLYHAGCMWFATSQSDPQLLHRVTLVSCDCLGYQHHQRCKHLAALLWATGNMPERPAEPEPPTTADTTTETRCSSCFGDGWLPRGLGREDCPRCNGTGKLVIHWGAIAPTEINYPLPPAA